MAWNRNRSTGPGGGMSTGPGGGMSTGPGGGISTGPGGGMSTGPGGGRSTGPGGGLSTEPGGGLSTGLTVDYPQDPEEACLRGLAEGYRPVRVEVSLPGRSRT